MEKQTALEFNCVHCGEPIQVKYLKPGNTIICPSCGRRTVDPELDQRTEKEREIVLERELKILFDRWFPKEVSAWLILAFSIYLSTLGNRETPFVSLRALIDSSIFQDIVGTCVFASGAIVIVIGFALFFGGAAREGFKLVPTITMTVLFEKMSERPIDPLIVRTFKILLLPVLGIELLLLILRLTY